MQFKLYNYLTRHPIQMKVVKFWVKMGLPTPAIVKLQLANEIHAEMIARLMDELIKGNGLTLQKALEVHFVIGTEIAKIVEEFLEIDPNDARSLARTIDFLHSILLISGKKVIHSTKTKSVSHWERCPLSEQLAELKDGGGPYYCHLYQEIYKGLLYGINKNARANDLTTTASQGCGYCRLETWIEEEDYKESPQRGVG